MCKHQWKIISSETTKSKFQHAAEVARENFSSDDDIKIPGQMCNADRKHIQILTCTICGKLKRFVENI